MPQPRYVIISTMKNEAPFIVDWLAHHLVLGFEHFVIATNDCEDTTNEIIDRVADLTGKVTRHKTIIRRGGIHRSALRQCYYRYEPVINCEWCYVCDVDEFLNIKVGDGGVEDLLGAASSQDVSAIAVPWRLFGTPAWPRFQDKPICHLSYQCEFVEKPFVHPDITGKHPKTIFRPSDMISRPGIHFPVIKKELKQDYTFEYPGGIKWGGDQDFDNRLKSYEFAQVNHYAVRSFDSYLVKINRGRANHMNDNLGQEYWNFYNRRDQIDESIDRYKDKFLDMRNQLMSDPVIKDMHNRGIIWHMQKVHEMRNVPEVQEFINSVEIEMYLHHLPSQL